MFDNPRVYDNSRRFSVRHPSNIVASSPYLLRQQGKVKFEEEYI